MDPVDVDARRTVTLLGERCLRGAVTVEELHAEWPSFGSDSPAGIFEVLEAAVEHYPIGLISGRHDQASWESTDTYQRAWAAVRLLGSELDLREIVAALATVAARLPVDRASLEQVVADEVRSIEVNRAQSRAVGAGVGHEEPPRQQGT